MTKPNSKLTWMLAGILSAAIFYFPVAAFAHMGGHGDFLREPEKDPIETVTGEVLSLSCYLKYGAAGKREMKPDSPDPLGAWRRNPVIVTDPPQLESQ